jgi:hypothetical protein
MMTGRNVASGVPDHEAMAQYKHPGGWRYVESDEAGVGTAFTLALQRDIRFSLMTRSGGRTFRQSLAETEMGVAMCAADATGRRVRVKDAHGIDNATTEISLPRWAACHEGERLPDKWCTAFLTNMTGDAVAAPMDIPREQVPGMPCGPSAMVLEYNKPAYRDPSSSWLIAQGSKEKMKGSVPVGSSTLMPGSDYPQLVGLVQEAQWLAAQELDFGFLSRVTAAVKLAEELNVFHIG